MARRKSSKRKSRKLRRKLRKKSRRRRRGGLIPPQEESFEKAYVGPKEYGSLGSPTCYGPRDCTSAKAKQDKRMCLSFGYNPKTGQSDCQWGVPPAPKPMPIMKPTPAPKPMPIMKPTICEDDMTFIRQGPHSTGRPLCEVIKSRKAEISWEKDPVKRAKMVQMVIKNCSNLGAKHCKKTCGKCKPKQKPPDRCRNLKGKESARCGYRKSKEECEKKEKRRPGDRNKKKWKPFCKWTGDKKGGKKSRKKRKKRRKRKTRR